MESYKFYLVALMALCGAFATMGCSNDDDDDDVIVTPTVKVSGKAIDGYLAGALVCVDSNLNKVCDAGEPSDTTDAEGNYNIDTTDTTSPLVLEVVVGVTTDLSDPSGEPIDDFFMLTAPAGSTNITPLTTLAQVQSEVSGLTYQEAQAAVVADLGLSGVVTDLTTYDFIAAQSDPDPVIAQAAVEATLVAEVVTEVIANNTKAIQASASAGSATTDRTVRALAVAQISSTAVQEIATETQAAVTVAVAAAGSVADVVAALQVQEPEEVVTGLNVDELIGDAVMSAGDLQNVDNLLNQIDEELPDVIVDDPTTGGTGTT